MTNFFEAVNAFRALSRAAGQNPPRKSTKAFRLAQAARLSGEELPLKGIASGSDSRSAGQRAAFAKIHKFESTEKKPLPSWMKRPEKETYSSERLPLKGISTNSPHRSAGQAAAMQKLHGKDYTA